MPANNSRAKSPRGRLHLRLAAREVAEIQQATKTAGATTPAAYFLSLVRQQRDVEALATQIERQLHNIVEVAVGAAIAQMGDRLASDLATLSSGLVDLSTAMEARPTKDQLSQFIDHEVRRAALARASKNGATVAP